MFGLNRYISSAANTVVKNCSPSNHLRQDAGYLVGRTVEPAQRICEDTKTAAGKLKVNMSPSLIQDVKNVGNNYKDAGANATNLYFASTAAATALSGIIPGASIVSNAVTSVAKFAFGAFIAHPVTFSAAFAAAEFARKHPEGVKESAEYAAKTTYNLGDTTFHASKLAAYNLGATALRGAEYFADQEVLDERFEKELSAFTQDRTVVKVSDSLFGSFMDITPQEVQAAGVDSVDNLNLVEDCAV